MFPICSSQSITVEMFQIGIPELLQKSVEDHHHIIERLHWHLENYKWFQHIGVILQVYDGFRKEEGISHFLLYKKTPNINFQVIVFVFKNGMLIFMRLYSYIVSNMPGNMKSYLITKHYMI